ncbi:MAG: ATP-binding protein [Bacteroidales bacterium]
MDSKRLTIFEWLVKNLIDNPEEFSLEHRFFIVSCFVGGMAGLLATVINLALSLQVLLTLTTSAITIIYFLFYYLSLKKQIFKGLVFPYVFISLLTLSYVWFMNAGSSGPVSYVIVTALLVYIVLTRGNQRHIVVAVVLLTLFILLLWEYLYPEIVVDYTNPKSKLLDIYFTAFFSIGLIAFIASYIMKNYHDERELVLKQRDKIIDQNKEIKETEKELLLHKEHLEELVEQRTLELEKANKELIASKEKAEESDRLKTAFLSNMSHEIRTPMNAIIGFSSLLKEPETSKENFEKYIQIINNKGNLLLNIINDIIDIAKVEAGEIEIHKSKCNIYELFDELYTTYRKSMELADKSHIVFRIKKPKTGYDIIIETDPARLKQILSNLIDNAIKFTDHGFIEAGYSFGEVNDDQIVVFYVKDSGIGISDENKQIIFNRFRQIDESHTRSSGGTGLGLAISKNLVALLGGDLKVDSIPGKGSTFSFSIPLDRLNVKVKDSGGRNEGQSFKKKWRNKTILIVEDNNASYFLLKNYLLETEADLILAKDGEKAVQLCKDNNDIDLVLMDIQLPIMNGYEATEQIKEIRKGLPIIAQTAHALPEDSIKSKNAGCDEHLSKPFSKEELLSTIGKYLG